MIGKTISHYKILEKLGGGGMGVVYKAQDLKLDRFVALKFLPHHLSADEEEKKRFIHEAKAASALDHPNICVIHEIDETEDGQIFICMAYYEGETLKKRIASGEGRREKGEGRAAPIAPRSSPFGMTAGLPLTEVIDIANQIAQGLARAHEHGITHRDIKPANVMITKDGVIKIVDFGLAKLAGQERITKSGMTVGTVAYMSPEQAQGIDVDHRTDIWALGIVLYEMVTGQLPFLGEYEQAVVYSIVNEDAKPVTSQRTDAPLELERIVNKAMAKNLDERYQRVDEMLLDLKALRKDIESGISRPRLMPRMMFKTKRGVRYASMSALVLLLVLAGLYLWQTFGDKAKKPHDKIRLAVLPFDNITQNPEDEYFADGMTDEMISKLSKISGFGVIARTSVMHYKTKPKTVAEIGQELQVSKILEGSVRKAAEKLRITVKLIDVKTQEPVWSTEYDKELADVFAIQSEVAQQVAAALRVELTTAERNQIEKRGTESVEAYNLYLQGHYYADKRTPQGLNKGIEYFNEAIKIDPKFAHAYAGLAKSYHFLGYFGYLPPIELYPKARAAAERALELDHTIAEAHTELAVIMNVFDWDWLGAERTFKHALALNPDYTRAHQAYGAFLMFMGRNEEAFAEIKRSQEFNPLWLESHNGEGLIHYYGRRYDDAIEKLTKTIEMQPNYFIPYLWLGLSYLEKGRVEEAIAAIQKCITLSRGYSIAVAAQGYVFAKSGKRTEARKIVMQLQQLSQQRYVPPSLIALIYAGLSEKDQAFEWLEKAYRARDINLAQIKESPFVDNLRSDPRFAAWLKKMDLEK
ncbi:protein kinase [candidate division KSB1 bacterium]|nr:protein kinase [candidate division KSB1 bacterium]